MKAETITGAFSQYADATEAALERMSQSIASLREQVAGLPQERAAAAEDPRIAAMQSEIAELRGQVEVLTRSPAPVAGPPGPAGPPGERGADGADGISSEEEIRRIADEHVRSALAANMRSWYQGLFRAGEQYRQGQGATWDGGLWIANADTTSKPGTDDTWSLAVKRGRDGRDR